MTGPARGRALAGRCALIVPVVLLLAACAAQIPPCPFTGKPDYALSAGCLAVVHGRVLVVESIYGGVTPPGGKSLEGESAQCTAHRETWEETGLDLLPRQLVHVFDTGFHLYYCEIHAGSGRIELGPGKEVEGWRWLSVEDFDKVRWRFAGQGDELRRLLGIEE